MTDENGRFLENQLRIVQNQFERAIQQRDALRAQRDELREDVRRLISALVVISDYVDNPTASTVNAGEMTVYQRLAGIGDQAAVALESVEMPPYEEEGTHE